MAMLAGLVAATGCPPADRPTQSTADPTDTPAPRPDPPELVLLISLDTLRPDRLGCYGHDRDTSPQLDRLAAQGVVFATVAAQATQTLISHKSLLAAQYPLRLARETTNADLETLKGLQKPTKYIQATFGRTKATPLVATLRDAGYLTAAFTDGIWMTRHLGFETGFAHFDERAGHLQAILPRLQTWLQTHSTGRRFVFLHAYDVHCPYWCREPFNSRFCTDHTRHLDLRGICGKTGLMNMQLTADDLRAISDHYDGGIASADAYLGTLFDALREMDLYDQALIVFTSDHGESLGGHGQIGHGGLYLEQLMVPLIFKFPASWKLQPQVIGDPVELLDVMPTILEACNVELPPALDGRSLLPVQGHTPPAARYLVTQMTFREGPESISNPAKRSILEPGRWLLIHDARAPALELFDLTADPAGLVDVADRKLSSILPLMAALADRDQGRATDRFVQPQTVQISDQLRKELESLGYVGD